MLNWQQLPQDKYWLADLLTPKYNKEIRGWKWRYASGERLAGGKKKKKANKEPYTCLIKYSLEKTLSCETLVWKLPEESTLQPFSMDIKELLCFK